MIPEQSRYAPFYRMLIALASVAIIVAGIRAASSIVGPFLMTLIIGLFAVPLESILVRRKIHAAIAFILVFGLVLIVMLLVMLAMSIAAAQFQASQVLHQEHVAARAAELAAVLESFGFTVTDPIVAPFTVEPFNAATVVINEMISSLSDSFLVIMLVFFLLMDAPGLVSRLRSSVGYENPLIHNLGDFILRFLGSLYILTAMNLVQALYIFVFLVIVGVDFAALWANPELFDVVYPHRRNLYCRGSCHLCSMAAGRLGNGSACPRWHVGCPSFVSAVCPEEIHPADKQSLFIVCLFFHRADDLDIWAVRAVARSAHCHDNANYL